VPRHTVALLLILLTAGCGASVRYVSDSGAGAYEAALTTFGDGFAAAWYDTRDGNAEIYMRLLDGDGNPAGPERRLTTDREDSYEADIIAVDNAVAVAWYDKSANGVLRPRVGMWTAEGRQRWTAVLAPSGRNTIVRARGHDLFVAWITDGDAGAVSSIWGQFLGADGKPLDMPIRLAPAGRTTFNLNAEVDRYGRAWVVFDAKAGTRNEELFLVRAGSPPMRLTPDDGIASTYPDIALNGGRVAVTWSDERDGNKEIYLAVVAGEDLADRFEARSRRVTMTRGESIGSYLAWNGPVLGMAWSDNTEGQHEIYLQFFDVGGRELTMAERQTETPRASLVPAIQPWRDGFALAWNEYEQPAESHGSTGKSEIAFTVVD
jgi:hypothetical protein